MLPMRLMKRQSSDAASARQPVPTWLRGLWRRRSIEYPDGRRDDTTVVYWLQAESAFADIRIPGHRPDLRARGGLTGLSEEERAALALQAGFAGWTELTGDRCRWHRTIDYQPPSGVPDEGRLRLHDSVLIEEGVHDPYVEVWEPIECNVQLGPADIATVRPTCVAHHTEASGRRESLVVCGDVFIYARDRATALPQAVSLEALVRAAAGRPSELVHLLDCEISFGLCRGGRVPWEIRLSTLPFREGGGLATAESGEIAHGSSG